MRPHKRQPDHPHAPRAAAIPRPAARSSTSVWHSLAAAAAVGLIVLVVYWPALSSTAFYLDDKEYVLENELVQRPGWQSTGRFFGEVTAPSTVRGYYQPLAMVSLMLDAAAAGPPQAQPAAAWVRPFHRTSLLLHVLNAVSLVLVLVMLLERTWPAAIAGLLWGLHPLTVEPVPWIAERKTLLATFFVLWALILYVRYVRRTDSSKRRSGGHPTQTPRANARRWMAYGGVVLLYVLALLSKPSALPLPLLLLVLDFWPLRRICVRTLLEKVPLFAVAVVAAILAFASQANTGAVSLPWHQEAGRAVLVCCHNLVFYVMKVICPTGLFPLYLAPDPLTLSQPSILVGVVGTLALAAATIVSLRRTGAIAACLAFFVVAVFPTLGIVAVHGAIAADRHMYLPLAGFALLVGWGLARSSKLLSSPNQYTWLRPALVAAVLLACVGEALATRSYLSYWRDSEILHRRVIAMAPQAVQPRWELGYLLRREGRMPEAMKEYAAAVELAPTVPSLRHDYGAALAARGDTAAAIAQYQKALELEPRLVPTRNLLALLLADRGRFDEALAQLAAALDQEPGLAFTLNHCGVVLEKAGRLDEAVAQYQAAVTAQRDFAVARLNLARARCLLGLRLERQGLVDQAVREYRNALQVDPGCIEAHNRLAALGY